MKGHSLPAADNQGKKLLMTLLSEALSSGGLEDGSAGSREKSGYD